MLKTEDLTERLKAQINEYLPDLTIVEGLIQAEANLHLEVDLTAKSDGTLYGFSRITFQRDIIVRSTDFAHNWQVWEDLITFDCDQNPGPEVHYNIELHAKKLCAMIILARRYQEL